MRQWCGWIEQYAAEVGLEARLVAAVMLQESGGNAEAYSHSGAVGLMQVMPRDGLAADFMCSGRPCFSSRPSMEELFNPEYNISYGTRMLAALVSKKGSVRDALYAYGPMDMGYRYADLVMSIYENYQ
ncbi:lytic transglycosylase domain-containing protein [bacterium]|nr:MAG: lytic transglycosylase domain-containing protein [bacterium]